MIAITVHVPERRVEEFYGRFGEFLTTPPGVTESSPHHVGNPPAWSQDPDAQERVKALWRRVSPLGRDVLRALAQGALAANPQSFTTQELADATQNIKGKQALTGVLGGVGNAIQRTGLPKYGTPVGNQWHYVWDWDGERYSMSPDMARLLLTADA